jgi:hypothetical protein
MKSYNLSVKVPQDAKVPQAVWSPAQHSLVALNGFSHRMDCQETSTL